MILDWRFRCATLAIASLPLFAGALAAQAPALPDSVAALVPPRTPFPSEAATLGTTRFSFIMYGDTRGRHDGSQVQAEHQLVIESMLSTIRKAATTPDAIRFVVQSGDAIQNGSVAAQINVSYAPLINRLMREGDVSVLPRGRKPRRRQLRGSRRRPSRERAAELLRRQREAHPRRGLAAPPRGLSDVRVRIRQHVFHLRRLGHSGRHDPARVDAVAARRDRPASVHERRRLLSSSAVFFRTARRCDARTAGGLDSREVDAACFTSTTCASSSPATSICSSIGSSDTRTRAARTASTRSCRAAAAPHSIRTAASRTSRAYVAENAAVKVSLEHLARPSSDPGANPFHYVVVHVDGDRFNVEVVGVDWGKGFAPYRSSTATLNDPRPANP